MGTNSKKFDTIKHLRVMTVSELDKTIGSLRDTINEYRDSVLVNGHAYLNEYLGRLEAERASRIGRKN